MKDREELTKWETKFQGLNLRDREAQLGRSQRSRKYRVRPECGQGPVVILTGHCGAVGKGLAGRHCPPAVGYTQGFSRNQEGGRNTLIRATQNPACLSQVWQIYGRRLQIVTVHISFLSQQNIVKKEHHVSELDVNQKERDSGEIWVQIIGQTFLSCIKKSHKDQYLQKPEFHYP